MRVLPDFRRHVVYRYVAHLVLQRVLLPDYRPQDLVAVTWTRRLSSAVRTEPPYATARIAFWLLRSGSCWSDLR
jgi:hypothetical protein